MSEDPDIRIAIDRGGTFCDVIAYIPGRVPVTFKLLSEDPANYRDAPTEAVRKVLEIAEGRKIPVGEALDGSRIGQPCVSLRAPVDCRCAREASVNHCLDSIVSNRHDYCYQCIAGAQRGKVRAAHDEGPR